MPMASAPSVPGRTGSHISAFEASQVRAGSMTMMRDPRRMRSTIQCPTKPSGLEANGSLPQMTMTSGIS